MQWPPPVESQAKAPQTRRRLFLFGALGLLPAIVLAGAIELGLRASGVDGRVAGLFFVAAAGLTPVLAVGLLPRATRAPLRPVRT